MGLPGGWVLVQRIGPELRVKRRSDVAPGESFQESTHSAARGVSDALVHSGRVAIEIYADLRGLDPAKAARIQRLDDHAWDAVVGAFRHGEYVIVGGTPQTAPMAWGAKVSAAFRMKVSEICRRLGTKPDYLMACMAFESAGTFSPSIRNKAGSRAVGLIQFMPVTALLLGTNSDKLAAMSAEKQLDYVAKYFEGKGKLPTIEDLYMAILYPRAIGKDNGFVIFRNPSIEYHLNSSLDRDGDGKITKFEAGAAVRHALLEGLKHAG